MNTFMRALRYALRQLRKSWGFTLVVVFTLAMVMGESLWILAAWLLVGLPLTYLAIRQLKAMLYQMPPFDPVRFALQL